MTKQLTYRQLKERGWPFSRQHTDRLIKEGKFLRPFKAVEGGKTNLWGEEEYEAHIRERMAARDTEKVA
jgi:hypothetical protein